MEWVSPIYLKRVFLAFILMLVFIAGQPAFTLAADDLDNLLQNPGFEQKSEQWTADSWISGQEGSRFMAEQGEARSGSGYLILENRVANDAKWVQKVKVEAEAYYRFSAWLKAEGADPELTGANVSVLGTTATSEHYHETNGEWTYVELIGKTGREQTEMKVALRLGGYGSLNQGKAYFDDASLVKLEQAPENTAVVSFEPEQTGSAAADPDSASSRVSLVPPLVFSLLFFILFTVIYLAWINKEEARLPNRHSSGQKEWFGLALAAAFLLRLWIAHTIHGHPGDMATFAAWAGEAAASGIGGFYSNAGFADYPPGYIYVLYLLGKVQQWFDLGASSAAFGVVLKMPSLLADLAAAILVYYLGKRRISAKAAFGLGLLYLFNPAVIVNSAAWGQVDSFFALFLAAGVVLLTEKRVTGSCILFAVALLIKPQTLIFAPVLILALIASRSWKKAGVGLAAGAAVFVAGIVPFALYQRWDWIIRLYMETLQSYPYATLNAFNFFALTGANWKSQEALLLGLSYKTWGWLFIVAVTLFTAWLFFRRKKGTSADYYLLALVLIATVFVMGVKMHERYLFPGLLFALLSFISTRDRRLLQLFIAFSITFFINVSYVLQHGLEHLYAVGRQDGLLLLTSAANVVLWGYLIWTAWDLFINGRVKKLTDPPVKPSGIQLEKDRGAIQPAGSPSSDGNVPHAASSSTLVKGGIPLPAEDEGGASKQPFGRKDWLWMTLLTILYAAVALYQLGSFQAPETAWKPGSYGESLTIDLGEVYEIERTNGFSGIGDGSFSLEYAVAPDQWNHKQTIDLDYAKVFKWTSLPVQDEARYIRLTVNRSGFELKELAFFAKDNPQPLPVFSISAADGASEEGAAALFDEQDAAVYHPSFMHSTYFDEIYHARAAYEHLEGIKPYENTHPPLGKELIAVGVYLFGMNPFGWRIVGTLFGIAMIPLMYLFARRMLGKPVYGVIAALLMAFDFMHFAQTRIATIDVYGVFFIMLMYYFMYRYYTMNFYRDRLSRTLVPLFWSGLFFGIGAASKWIVIYGGLGLAFLFFLSLYERYKEYDAAKKALQNAPLPSKHNPYLGGEQQKPNKDDQADGDSLNRLIISRFPRYALASTAWCGLFFVIIPLAVYGLSFLPIMLSPGQEVSWAKLIQYQLDMFSYHSGLVATHSFSSPWWEWPFMVRPIWFYSGQALLPDDQVSSIVSMGNPAIWWLGTLAVLVTAVWLFKGRSKGMLVVVVAFCSQYIPWMLVPRLTFIYHYFAMVPFVILCLTYWFKRGMEAEPRLKYPVYGYVGICAALFAWFYPILSGQPISKAYASLLKWFQSWYFYS